MRSNMQGLTLVEVLVALGILAIIGSVIVSAFLSSLTGNNNSRKRTYAAQLLNTASARVTQHSLTVSSGETTYLAFNASSTSTALSATVTNCTEYLNVNASNYCVSASNNGTFNPTLNSVALLTTPQEVYSLKACWKESEVKCLETKALY